MRWEILPTFTVVPCTQTDLWRIRARWPDGRNHLIAGVGFSTTRECWNWIRLRSIPILQSMKKKLAKRPRDTAQLAKAVVDLATMDDQELAELRKRQTANLGTKKRQTPGKRGSLGK
jgi:hypothetical protein